MVRLRRKLAITVPATSRSGIEVPTASSGLLPTRNTTNLAQRESDEDVSASTKVVPTIMLNDKKLRIIPRDSKVKGFVAPRSPRLDLLHLHPAPWTLKLGVRDENSGLENYLANLPSVEQMLDSYNWPLIEHFQEEACTLNDPFPNNSQRLGIMLAGYSPRRRLPKKSS